MLERKLCQETRSLPYLLGNPKTLPHLFQYVTSTQWFAGAYAYPVVPTPSLLIPFSHLPLVGIQMLFRAHECVHFSVLIDTPNILYLHVLSTIGNKWIFFKKKR
jgi:hypothetical protein